MRSSMGLIGWSVLLTCAPALAQITWTGQGDGRRWTDTDNWDSWRTPGPGDVVIIPDVPETDEVVIEQGESTTIMTLRCNEPFRLVDGSLSYPGRRNGMGRA